MFVYTFLLHWLGKVVTSFHVSEGTLFRWSRFCCVYGQKSLSHVRYLGSLKSSDISRLAWEIMGHTHTREERPDDDDTLLQALLLIRKCQRGKKI